MIQRLTSLFDRRPQTAEAWLARMRRPSVPARDQAAFLEWLEADDDHLQQYEAAKAGLAELSPLSGAFSADLARLRRRAVRSQRRLLIAGGLATGAVAALAAFVLVLPGVGREPPVRAGRLYASAPGQITDVALEDGSRVTLDADTRIQVAYSRDARRVVLLRGAAYFDVAHNAEQPFQVAAEDRRVIVTGTRFAVALRKSQAEVSLLEGRVAIGRTDVGKARALERAVALAPGQQAVFTPGRDGLRVRRIDVDAATAWRERRLVFHDTPLSVVIDEAGRYAGTPMVIADPALADMRVTAVLPLTGEAGLIDRMDALLPITVEHTADGRALIRAD
ncbi:protein FpvR [Brevundimonas intermedia]|uniref:Protein FpvR n=1 Tax=Brevundimonas intermedia TaxID=74315 RepID=A0ABQ5TDE2_9CAUL|nr:FecR domain-containing protein [Brevundimonas intermedia]GLK50358.1 protein FpvR [Brevundimonas intermedia]